MMLTIGQKAPEFRLEDQEGKAHSLSDYAGRWLVIYFYPKDDTPGCTKEACNFQENISKLAQMNVAVLGVSADSVKSHGKFAHKYNLGFPLLSDPDKEMIKAYGVWGKKKFMGREYEGIMRSTYIIDPEGKVAQVYENVNPKTHVDEIVRDLGELMA